MGDRRMLTKKVTDDDNFMSLSSSAQALYLHLSMSADDDGFSNQVSISMFKAHASVQDLQALLEKRYIYQFQNGVIVIKHWRMANALRKDRYTPTEFQEELAQLELENNGTYSRLPDGCQVVANCLPQLNNKLTKQTNKLNKSKGRVSEFVPPTLEDIEAYCKERNSPVDPKTFYDYFSVGHWKDSKGDPVRNWKQKLITWEKRHEGGSYNRTVKSVSGTGSKADRDAAYAADTWHYDA